MSHSNLGSKVVKKKNREQLNSRLDSNKEEDSTLVSRVTKKKKREEEEVGGKTCSADCRSRPSTFAHEFM